MMKLMRNFSIPKSYRISTSNYFDSIKRIYNREKESSCKGIASQWKCKERLMNIIVKPPNILVFADSACANESIKNALSSMVNKDKYAIYDLPNNANQTMWNKSTILVIVCGTVPPNLASQLIKFFLDGGQLLCLCSNLLWSVVNSSSIGITEHELISFSYGKWKHVKVMHKLSSYPALFDKNPENSPNQCNGTEYPTVVEIQYKGKYRILQVEVFGTEETCHIPCLFLVTAKDGNGKAVFSQVHLEVDPNGYKNDDNKFAALKESDEARLDILKDILVSHLDIDCYLPTVECVYSPAYLLGDHEAKINLLNDCKSIQNKILETEKLTLKFCIENEHIYDPSSSFLPVHVYSHPTNFSAATYFDNLNTENMGRLVIYSDVITSTQYVLTKKLKHGVAVITRQQTEGQGRSNNIWLTPLGCAPCSLQVHVQLDSTLGKVLPLLQHLATLATVSAIRGNKDCKDLDIGIKWPNDVYVNGTVKIGGILINSFVMDNTAIISIGFGVNLNNSNPTLCINEIIRISNETKGTNIKTISFELFFASIFNEFEKIFKTVEAGDIEYFYDLYYTYWLHNSNDEVTVTDGRGVLEKGKIVGIDNFGFLRIIREDGSLKTVHPDGNRFDMLCGLIYPKI